jgi:DNA end-binding protein Ku
MAGTSAGHKATVGLGLVTVPVRLQVTADDDRPQFNQLHAPCGARVRYRKVCEGCGNEVSPEEIVKGFQVDRETYVQVTDEDLEALPVATKKSFQVELTLGPSDIDPVMFTGKSYYVQPEDVAAHAYGLVLGAFLAEDKAGLGRFAFRESRERLALLRARADTLVLELLYWPAEIRTLSAKDYEVGSGTKGEMGLARQLVDSLSGSFDPAAYKDTYREMLLARIEEKQAGIEPVAVEAAPAGKGITDLQAALKASVEASKKKATASRGRKAS